MGEVPDPPPEDLPIAGAFFNVGRLYVAISGGVLPLSPIVTWDLIEAAKTSGIYFLHSIESDHLEYVTIYDNQMQSSVLVEGLSKLLDGASAPVEDVALDTGAAILGIWLERRAAIERIRESEAGLVPWNDLDIETLGWYAHQLEPKGPAGQARKIIQERLLNGRDRLTPGEVLQLSLLFAKVSVVRRILRRDVIDCRARKESGRRWEERVESSENILESLRAAIGFFSRHVGI